MGDSGSNLLGLLLGCVAVEGAVKTQAVLALVFPLLVLAVPFLDTTFVVLKRLKYRRAPWRADANHFHHRLNRVGFGQRRAVAILYGWTLALAAFAVRAAVHPLLRRSREPRRRMERGRRGRPGPAAGSQHLRHLPAGDPQAQPG